MQAKFAQNLIQLTKDYYENNADSFAAARNRNWPLFLSFLQYIKKGDRVLDLGCGNGRLYPLVKQKGASYLGLDLSKNLLSKARKMYPQGKFIQGDLLNLKVKDQFDAIFIIATLNHIPTSKLRQKAIQNVTNILKPEGLIFLTNWNLFQKSFFRPRVKNNFQKIIGQSKLDFNSIIFKQKRYYHAFTKREIAGLFKKQGFKILKNYFERDGRKVSKWRGNNLVTIAQLKTSKF